LEGVWGVRACACEVPSIIVLMTLSGRLGQDGCTSFKRLGIMPQSNRVQQEPRCLNQPMHDAPANQTECNCYTHVKTSDVISRKYTRRRIMRSLSNYRRTNL
ncbi:unnamed protein product, partial [Ectocarpus sp. 12 AP-2014]